MPRSTSTQTGRLAARAILEDARGILPQVSRVQRADNPRRRHGLPHGHRGVRADWASRDQRYDIYPLPGPTYDIKHSVATPRLRNADVLVYGVFFLTQRVPRYDQYERNELGGTASLFKTEYANFRTLTAESLL